MTIRRRRMFVLLITIVLLVLSCGVPQKEYTYSNFLFGSQCSIKFYYIGDDRAREITEVIDLELIRLDSLLNYYSEASLVTELNRTGRAVAPGDIIYLVNVCDSVSRLTDGLFDITVAPVLQIWGFYDGQHRVPSADEIARARQYVDYRRIHIAGDTIVLDPGMKVDFGGIAQGYAADRAALILRQRHVKTAIIDIGGEVLTIGKSPKGRPWRVGIRHPRGKGLIETIEVEDTGVSTSGDYEKFFIIMGARYPHIINPRTGWPAQDFVSATVITDNTTYADALSTAVAIMGAQDGIDFLDSLGIHGIIFHEVQGVLQRVTNR